MRLSCRPRIPLRAAPGGAERASRSYNSTLSRRSQCPVYNFWTVNRGAIAARGAGAARRGSRKRGAKSATHAAGAKPTLTGLMHPGAPSGGGGAGGRRGEHTDTENPPDKRSKRARARAQQKARGRNAQKGGRKAAKAPGPERRAAKEGRGTRRPTRWEGQGAAEQGRPNREPAAGADAAARPDGGSECPRSA